jgi:hypothetical protein
MTIKLCAKKKLATIKIYHCAPSGKIKKTLVITSVYAKNPMNIIIFTYLLL